MGVLALMKEEAVGATYDLDAEEVVQGPKSLRANSARRRSVIYRSRSVELAVKMISST